MPGFNYVALKLQEKKLEQLKKAQERVHMVEQSTALRMLIARATMRNLLIQVQANRQIRVNNEHQAQLLALAEDLANARGNRTEENSIRAEIQRILCNNKVNLQNATEAASQLQYAIKRNIEAAKQTQ
jgi:hypothetical protein